MSRIDTSLRSSHKSAFGESYTTYVCHIWTTYEVAGMDNVQALVVNERAQGFCNVLESYL